MLDTNVLFSAIFFPSERMNALIDTLTRRHNVVLCSYSLEELHRITRKKMPAKLAAIEVFLQKFPYRLVHTPEIDLVENAFQLRDRADYPILLSALAADADIPITGDRDFDDVGLERPEIMTPAEFMRAYQ
ncbi:MAG: putative toxin-antitoxin system toxin component, PIN family [Clostridiales bacterium]|jgi:putative PIN family toxin of toxin-antitoxin system|nr:putative toxin-antitoxin system toxin component, PIN family [Clostridiales bacterium]